MTLAKRPAFRLFAGTAALIYLAVYCIARTPKGVSHAALVSVASVLDLTISASAAYYFLLVRNGHSAWFTMLAVAMSGLRAAGFLLPNADQQYLPSLKWISIPLEFGAMAMLIRRFHRIPASEGDALTRIRQAASAIIPYERLARIVASEVAVLYYALFSWRAKPRADHRFQAFSYGEAGGYSLFGTLLITMIVCEGVPMHLLLLHYKATTAAWIMTGLDIYALLWAIAITRSVQLRPILVGAQEVKIRIGLLWELNISQQDIASCRRITPTAIPRKTSNYLKAVVINDPQYLLELSRPAIAVGMYGQRRAVMEIGIAVDQAETFASLLCHSDSEGTKLR